MSTMVLTNRLELSSSADTALKVAARFWFIIAVLGQWLFAFYVAASYGISGIQGHFAAWNKGAHRYIPGDTVGNVAIAAHLFIAVIILVGGPLQLIPQIRSKAPRFHRWNGRVYLPAVFMTSIAGLYLVWLRGTIGDFVQHLGVSLDAVLIMTFAVLALRTALARDFRTHGRWALRLFMVVNGVWFFRVGMMLWLLINKGPAGFDPQTFTGPFISFLSYANYLFPLAILEVYLWTKDHPGTGPRFAMAGALGVLTVAMAVGIFAATMGMWIPRIKAAYDGRQSIAETLSATIASSGIDAAAAQYRHLKATAAAAYNFDKEELNTLGYDLIRVKKFKEAIRILALNVEAYPQSSNAYDSLGEAYMDDGNKPLAIANYQKSLELNPANHGAVLAIQKLSGTRP
jgi:uncharacterized membrane protein